MDAIRLCTLAEVTAVAASLGDDFTQTAEIMHQDEHCVQEAQVGVYWTLSAAGDMDVAATETRVQRGGPRGHAWRGEQG